MCPAHDSRHPFLCLPAPSSHKENQTFLERTVLFSPAGFLHRFPLPECPSVLCPLPPGLSVSDQAGSGSVSTSFSIQPHELQALTLMGQCPHCSLSACLGLQFWPCHCFPPHSQDSKTILIYCLLGLSCPHRPCFLLLLLASAPVRICYAVTPDRQSGGLRTNQGPWLHPLP